MRLGSSGPASQAVPISSIAPNLSQHQSTGIDELDRVLGGGVVPGSVTLLAGDPGVGKSTLLLKVAHRWAQSGRRVLYISGEESAGQIRLRADRIGCGGKAGKDFEEVYLAAESDLHTALEHIATVRPALVIVDSVQTMSTTEADGVAGGVTQVRAVTAALTAAAKANGVALILVGHVTKDGAIAGPRSLEHLVDVVHALRRRPHRDVADGPRGQESIWRRRRGRVLPAARQRNRRHQPIRRTSSWSSGRHRSPAPPSRSRWTESDHSSAKFRPCWPPRAGRRAEPSAESTTPGPR